MTAIVSLPNTYENLGKLVTGRSESLFSSSIDSYCDEITSRLQGKHIAIYGGAGTIGASTFELALKFEPARVDIIDISENSMAELARSVRAKGSVSDRTDLRFWLADVSSITGRHAEAQIGEPNHIWNFSAVKHVRSERDIPSILTMLMTNVLGASHVIEWAKKCGSETNVFSVSTDKAANPVNMMGASKRLMERMMLESNFSGKISCSRFANVAFSNGSLLDSWVKRFSLRQPLAVPKGVRRFLMSIGESAELCVLSATTGSQRQITYPATLDDSHLIELQESCSKFLERVGTTALFLENESDARRLASDWEPGLPYPVLLTELDTVGEKAFEEFLANGDEKLESISPAIACMIPSSEMHEISSVLQDLEAILLMGPNQITADTLVDFITRHVGNFEHKLGKNSLDYRI